MDGVNWEWRKVASPWFMSWSLSQCKAERKEVTDGGKAFASLTHITVLLWEMDISLMCYGGRSWQAPDADEYDSFSFYLCGLSP